MIKEKKYNTYNVTWDMSQWSPRTWFSNETIRSTLVNKFINYYVKEFVESLYNMYYPIQLLRSET